MTDPITARGTVLITGTSSGIGLATAVATAAAGWTTVATLRDPAHATALRTAAEEAGVTVGRWTSPTMPPSPAASARWSTPTTGWTPW